MAQATPDPAPRRFSSLQVGSLVLLLATLVASVGLRAYQHERALTTPAGANGLVDASGTSPATEPPTPPTPLERSLPYLTEASFFGLIGFALGYASRKFVKIGLIVLALFFVALQALVWTGSVSVDWSGMLGKLNALIFNLKADETMTQFLTRRVPAVGGMLLGYLVGFQRG